MIFVLVILVLLPPITKVWVAISFKINQEQIAMTLCGQKEVVNNTCQGKCFLKTQMAMAEEEEKNHLPIKPPKDIQLFSHKNNFVSTSVQAFFSKKTRSTFYSPYFPEEIIFSAFKPPKV